MLQGAIGSLLFDKEPSIDLLTFIVCQLDRLSKFSIGFVRKIFSLAVADHAQFCTKLAKLPLSIGAIILAGSLHSKEVHLDALCRWLSENSNAAEKNELVCSAFGLILSRTDSNSIQQVFLPLFSRLLLRSPSSALKMLLQIIRFNGCPTAFLIFGPLADSFWPLLLSENDDHRVISQKIVATVGANNNTPLLLPKVLELVGGKSSTKVKKSLMQTVLYLLKFHQDKAGLINSLNILLGKESNEEVIHLIVFSLCTLGADCDILWLESLKQTKHAIFCAYSSALSGYPVSLKIATEVCDLMTRKDTPTLNQLCLLLAVLDSKNQACLPSKDFLKGALRPSGLLNHRAVADALSKYPHLALWKLPNFFHLNLGEEFNIYLWRLMIVLGQNSICKKSLIDALHSAPYQLPITSLAKVCTEVSGSSANTLTYLEAGSICSIVLSSVKTQSDLIEIILPVHLPQFSTGNLWGRLYKRVQKIPGQDFDGQKILEKLASTVNSVESSKIFTAAALAFPLQLSLALVSRCPPLLQSIISNPPSHDDIKIWVTEEEKLPILGVFDPSLKTSETLSKKDPLKRPVDRQNSTNLAKADKATLTAQFVQELSIKKAIQSKVAEIQLVTDVTRAISKAAPAVLEDHLEKISNPLYTLASQDWISEYIFKFLYQLALCCAPPIGSKGHLLITLLRTVTRSSHCDREWGEWDFATLLATISILLVAEGQSQPTTKSTFYFMLPALITFFENCTNFPIQELDLAPIFQFICTHGHYNVSKMDIFRLQAAFQKIVLKAPSTTHAIQETVQALISNTDCTLESSDVCEFIKVLQSPHEQERRLGLFLIECWSQKACAKDTLLNHDLLRLWVAILAFDAVEGLAARRCAKVMYENTGGDIELVKSKDAPQLLQESINPYYEETIHKSAVGTFILAVKSAPPTSYVLEALSKEYKTLFDARFVSSGSIRTAKTVDATKTSRERLASTYLAISQALEQKDMTLHDFTEKLPAAIKFFLDHALFDPCQAVYEQFFNAASTLVSAALNHKELVDSIARVCEKCLAEPGKPDEEHDRVRVYAIVLLAKLANRFPVNDPRQKSLLSSLYITLSTPSESVQNAVADSMCALFSLTDVQTSSEYFEKFMQGLAGKSMAIRRGSAYGLGALVKGRSSRTIKEYGILDKLCKTISDKTCSIEARQGSLFGIELIAKYLGRHFEPYIVKILDTLISSLSEGRVEIHEATIDTIQTMMRAVSTLGARILLPVLISLTKSSSWRSKVGSIEWLGAMAVLSPRVLAKQLPVILPRLVDLLNDSHHSVQRAAREAMNRFGLVVRSPEIRALSSIIMQALANPPQATEKCLNSILHTAFAHVIDGPSLALLEPVLVRALRDRMIGGTEIKKRAAQIVGNIATDLADCRDLVFILGGMVPALVDCLSDPVPEVRANCGKVLGILVRVVGESTPAMSSLALDLMNIIGGITATSVDRAGAAQALAEILAARGPEDTGTLIEEKISSSLMSSKPAVREGFIMLVGYLPASFDAYGQLPELYEFGMCRIISVSLGLMADENEAVRDAATKACHNVIARFARIDHLVIFDILVETLSDPKWRCRLGCLQLFQEFLSKFSSAESDSSMGIFSLPTFQELIEGGIDDDRIKLLMSKAFLYRFDNSSSSIRHLALSIWKGLAPHPLRAITLILSTLMEECIQLGATEEGRDVASKALEDVLFKLGDRLLMPILDCASELYNHSDANQEGALYVVAVAADLLGSPSFPPVNSNLMDTFISKFILMIQDGLCSPRLTVRKEATSLFKNLVQSCQRLNLSGTIESILDPMLEELLTDPVTDPVTLEGLVSLLESNESVFSVAINSVLGAWPKLTDLDSATSVCKVVAAIFGTASCKGSSQAVPMLRVILYSNIIAEIDIKNADEALQTILASIEADGDSPYQISLAQLLETLYSENANTHPTAYRLIRIYCSIEGADLRRFYDVWPKRLLQDIGEVEARNTLSALLNCVRGSEFLDLAENINSSLTKPVRFDSTCKDLVAAMVKNIVVPLFTQSSLLRSDDNERLFLACSLCTRLLEYVAPLAWSSAITSLVGVLIRTASDKKTTGTVVFDALAECVIRQTILVKPFHPQLQRIFSNALAVESVRDSAMRALIALLPLLARPEPLLLDWYAQLESGCDSQVKLALLCILHQAKVKPDAAHTLAIAKACLSDEDTGIRKAASDWVAILIDTDEISIHRAQISSLLTQLN